MRTTQMNLKTIMLSNRRMQRDPRCVIPFTYSSEKDSETSSDRKQANSGLELRLGWMLTGLELRPTGETLWGYGNILCLIFGDGYMDVHIYQNWSNCALKMGTLYCM